jgi:hypothetical protein
VSINLPVRRRFAERRPTVRQFAARRVPALLATAVLLTGLVPGAAPGRAAAAVLAAPTLTAPASGASVTGNPVFSWTAVSDAVKYRIEVSTSAGFSSTVIADETQSLRFTPTTELPLGTLYWRVAARDASNTLGTYAGDSFTRTWATAPNPLGPADAATLTFPTDPLLFTWDPLRGAEYYELQVDDDSAFIGASTISTRNTAYVVPEPKTIGQTFYWRVRGVASGLYSDWSVVRSFSVQWPSVPTMKAPANGATVTDVLFHWEPVAGARTYQLQVSPNGDWANNVTIDVTVKGTRYSPPNTLNNGSYFWRVRAKDAAGTANNGLWSSVWQFNRGWPDRPVLLGPANGTLAVRELTFTWQPVAHAAYYELQWSTDPNFGTSSSCFTNHTTVTPYSTIVGGGEPGGCSLSPAPGATFYWHVRGIDPPVLNPGAGEPGVLGLWSNSSNLDVWSFVYQPYQPGSVSPANGATVEVPTLAWADTAGATRYKVTIVDKNLSQVASDTTYSTTWTPTSTLDPSRGPFKWYVQAYDAAGNLSLIPPTGSWWSFTVVGISTTYPSPAPTGPAGGASSNEMPSLTWEPVTAASYYRIWYSPNGVAFSQLGSQTSYAAYTYPNSVLPVGSYWWYVEAYNSSNVLIADSSGSMRTFLIVAPDLVGTGGYLAPAKCLPASPCDPIADTPTLTWSPIAGALVYRVYVAADPNFTNIYRTYETTSTRLTPRESYLDNQAGQAYYWFVRPFRSNNSGRFDSQAQQNASAFQKRSEGIHLASPANGASVADQITFGWQDFLATNQGLAAPVTQESKQYRIETSLVADFATTYESRLVDQPFYTPFDTTYPEGPVYWRVQATDGSNNNLTFSSIRSVTKTSPAVAQAYPADGATVPGVPYLQWAPQDYAAAYDVQLDDDANFSSQITLANTKMTAWAYAEPLAPGTYYWRVRRKDADNRDGPWSSVRSFVLAPGAPTLTSPANGANPSPTTLLLQWTSTRPTPRYTVELSTSSSFLSFVGGFPVTTVMSSYAPKTLLGNDTYYWRVKALNASGTVVATSATFSFTIDSSRPSVTALSPSSSAAITSPFTVTFSEAVTGVDDSTFVVTVAGQAGALAGTVAVLSPTSARFTPASLLVPGQTYAIALTGGISDLVGNPLLPYSRNVRTSTTVQQDSRGVKEIWGRWSTSSASGGSMKLSRTGSTKLSLAFTGTTIALVGYRGTSGGYASVYLDGVLQTSSLSFYASSSQYRRTLWSKSGLAAVPHTLQIVPRGTKPSAAKATWVYVDAFSVDGLTVEDSNAAVSEAFRKVSSSSASGGAYNLTSHISATGRSGPALTFQFKGTGISWYGTKGTSYGKASVYIDGSKKATVDLYRSSTAYKQKLWTSATLSNGLHTIKIVLTGTRRSAAKGYDVSFDYFAIR